VISNLADSGQIFPMDKEKIPHKEVCLRRDDTQFQRSGIEEVETNIRVPQHQEPFFAKIECSDDKTENLFEILIEK
jgi:hypothetical protein